MKLFAWIAYWKLLRTKPFRYRALFREINAHKPRRLVEIGVFNGHHAAQMIQTAALHHPMEKVEYYGFDLFEDLTPELLDYEKSKQPPTRAQVQAMLERSGARISLIKGNTRETLPAQASALGVVDFIFVDGGHSVETIQSDWEHIQPLIGPHTVVIFDDFYENKAQDVEGSGCQGILGALDPAKWQVEVLEPADRFLKEWGTLVVKFAQVRRRA